MNEQWEKLREFLQLLTSRLPKGETSPYKLAMLEYLAERKMIQERGLSTAETTFINTSFGPAGATFVQLIERVCQGKERLPGAASKWQYSSIGERTVLESVLTEHGSKSDAALLAHIGKSCPEWKLPTKRASEPLPMATVWQALGFSAQDIEELEDERQTRNELAESWRRSDERTRSKNQQSRLGQELGAGRAAGGQTK